MPEARYWRGMTLYRLGRTDEAQQVLRAIAEDFELFVIGIVWLMLLVLLGGTTGMVFTITAASFLLQAAVIAPFLIGLLYLGPVLASLGAGHFALEKLASSPETAAGARRGRCIERSLLLRLRGADAAILPGQHQIQLSSEVE